MNKDYADIVGKMRHQVQIIQLTKATDDAYGGEALTTASTLATVWASWEVKEVGSGEQILAGQKDLVQSVIFRIRYRTDVKTDMLILYENLYYDILSLLPDSHRRYITIEARQYGESWNQTIT